MGLISNVRVYIPTVKSMTFLKIYKKSQEFKNLVIKLVIKIAENKKFELIIY